MSKHLLCASLSFLLAGCVADVGDVEPVDATSDRLQTWYSGGGGLSRSVYAGSVNPEATPVVRATRKSQFGGCVNSEAPMDREPAWSVSAEVCAGLGAQVKVVNGEVQGCITSSSAEPLAVFRWTYTGFDTELNYNVLEYSGGNLVGQSGWMPPTLSNGCPRW
ncbi:hypothetical protein AB3662_01300 [Sorangium cellulosum]|uniref:hypothetical protein n=1 Tax=Sorangium cellulosum TaxID=56 RepID=UPI003D9AAC1D